MQQSLLATRIDWPRAATLRFVELDMAARRGGVTFSDYERARIVSMSLIEDALRALTVAAVIRRQAGRNR